MKCPFSAIIASALVAISVGGSAIAQADEESFLGNQTMEEGSLPDWRGFEASSINDALRYEPEQSLVDMFTRDDVVYLMRHGPTDWSKRDVVNVSPSDCSNQRVLSPEGIEQMRDLGSLLAEKGIVPSRIVTSEWCRNQQTLRYIAEGYHRVDPTMLFGAKVEVDDDLNLLLSLQGAPDVVGLRERISAWRGEPNRKGPLLLISHFTNIQELTEFAVFEGEILVLDPLRNNRVLGNVRLRSASPDTGHFEEVFESPVLQEAIARDVVSRFNDAMGRGDPALLNRVVADNWREGGVGDPLEAEEFLARQLRYMNGLEGATFEIEDVHVADDIVTVTGSIRGVHSDDFLGVPATGREVRIGSVAVHKVRDGAILESRQYFDERSAVAQLTAPF
ncbi:MAG: ester cyclase [Pseudomonadota bacterium]